MEIPSRELDAGSDSWKQRVWGGDIDLGISSM